MTDKSNLAGFAAGARRERFETLYAEHHARVLSYVLRRTERTDDAADVVAETFLVAWRRLDDVPVEEARLWLYGVARCVLSNHRRGERRRTQLAGQLRHDLAGRHSGSADEGEFAQLAAAFRSLSDGDREVLALEAWEQLDAGEIAAVLGCSRNAARIRLHRARRRLRAAIASPTGHRRSGALRSRPVMASLPPIGERPEEQRPGARGHQHAGAIDTIATRGDNS